MDTRDHKEGGEIDHLHGLQIAKFTLGNLYKWGKDMYEKNEILMMMLASYWK